MDSTVSPQVHCHRLVPGPHRKKIPHMNRLLLAVVAVALCSDPVVAQGTAPGAVVGTVAYRQRMALPPDAVVEVQLQDTTRADAAARTIGHATIPTRGAQVPIPFRIEYDPASIDPAHSYSVRANITVGGRLLYSSPTMYPVLTRGAGNEAAIEVYMILPADAESALGAKPAASLEGTFWRLVAIGDTPAIAMPAAREASFTLHSGDHRLSGSGGCNRLLGTFETGADTLRIIPSGTTMMACAEELMNQENDFVAALKMTTNYRLTGDTLELRSGDRVLARFMAQNNR
jgi:putative lipoprotein